MGKPTKLTPKVQETIVNAIVAGNYVEAACGFAGITKQAHYNWMNRGKEEKERVEASVRASVKASEKIYVDYLDAVSRSLQVAEVRAVSIITKAAMGGDEVKSKVTTTRTPVKVNGQVLHDEDGEIVYTEKTTTESSKAPPNWSAAAWYLERKNPERWGRHKLEISGPGGEPIPTTTMSAADYEKIIERRRERLEQNTAGISEEML